LPKKEFRAYTQGVFNRARFFSKSKEEFDAAEANAK
jgi:hypothetical protein